MMLQITAYDVLDGVHVLCQVADVSDTGRSWTLLIQELARPGAPLTEPWDLAWFVASLISSRAEERADWHTIVTGPAAGGEAGSGHRV